MAKKRKAKGYASTVMSGANKRVAKRASMSAGKVKSVVSKARSY